MSMPCWAASAISESASAPSRMRVKAHNSAERVPLRQCATTGAGPSRSAAPKASTSARDNVAAVIGMWWYAIPCASAMRRASTAGSCPGSSPSGRLLMIVRTPVAASASMSARSSLPATLTPGANANSWADIPVLRDDMRAASQPQTAASSQKSGGELRRALHKVAGADPEPLQAAERGVGALQVFEAHGGLRQHFGMAPMHRRQAVAQPGALFGQPYMDRTPIVQRALLRQISVLDHLFDVVRDV